MREILLLFITSFIIMLSSLFSIIEVKIEQQQEIAIVVLISIITVIFLVIFRNFTEKYFHFNFLKILLKWF